MKIHVVQCPVNPNLTLQTRGSRKGGGLSCILLIPIIYLNIQEVFNVYLNKFEIDVAHLFLYNFV